MKKELSYLLLLAVIFYLLYLLYPFYQRAFASYVLYGDKDEAKKFIRDLEQVASGMTYDETGELAAELKKPMSQRKDCVRLYNNPFRKPPEQMDETEKDISEKIWEQR